MVCAWGMSENLGPLTFGKREEMIFLGKEISQQRDYSEKTAVMIDEEVKSLVEGSYRKAYDLLEKNIDKLHNLANALLEREILDHEEIDKVLKGEQLEPLPKPRRGAGPEGGDGDGPEAAEEASPEPEPESGSPAGEKGASS